MRVLIMTIKRQFTPILAEIKNPQNQLHDEDENLAQAKRAPYGALSAGSKVRGYDQFNDYLVTTTFLMMLSPSLVMNFTR